MLQVDSVADDLELEVGLRLASELAEARELLPRNTRGTRCNRDAAVNMLSLSLNLAHPQA